MVVVALNDGGLRQGSCSAQKGSQGRQQGRLHFGFGLDISFFELVLFLLRGGVSAVRQGRARQEKAGTGGGALKQIR